MQTQAKGAGIALTIMVSGSLVASTPAIAAEAPGAAVVTAVERICLPLIAGQTQDAVSASSGVRARGGNFSIRLDGRGEVRVSPPGRANPTVCTASVSYGAGGSEAIVAGLDAWAAARTPPLPKTKTREQSKGADLQYWVSSWVGPQPTGMTAVVFTEQAELDGRPSGGALNEAVLLVNVTAQ